MRARVDTMKNITWRCGKYQMRDKTLGIKNKQTNTESRMRDPTYD